MPCCAWWWSTASRYTSTHADRLPAPVRSVTASRRADSEVTVQLPDGDVQPKCVQWANVPPRRLSGAHDTLGTLGTRAPIMHVDVPRATAPTITSYQTTPASGDTACDGGVSASVANVSASDEVELMWSTGELTTSPLLESVRPGLYVGVVVRVNAQPVPCLHACPPACVGVRDVA